MLELKINLLPIGVLDKLGENHVFMLKNVKDSIQIFAFSFKVKGNKVSHIISFDVVLSLIVWHRTWTPQICV